MKVVFFSAREYEKPFLEAANAARHELYWSAEALSPRHCGDLAGFDAVSVFTSDELNKSVLMALKENGTRFIAVRATGYDNVDMTAAAELGIRVANVPSYSPHAIAEHAVALMLALDRKLILADRQAHRHDFTINNLVGFNLHGKTVGLVGTGQIGRVVAAILHGFGCRILAYDVNRSAELEEQFGVVYTDLETLAGNADIISLHLPLSSQTRYMINASLINKMKKGAMLINTARGGVVNTADIIKGLESGQIGYYGMDVYEKEKGIFFNDLSGSGLEDKELDQLMNFPNVLLTPHQAFATREALQNIAAITMSNLDSWAESRICQNELYPARQ